MRDPKRIPMLLDMIRLEWERSPDLRLCQLISNVLHIRGEDIFHIEDEVLAAALFIKSVKK